jgi:hypothetical protein
MRILSLSGPVNRTFSQSSFFRAALALVIGCVSGFPRAASARNQTEQIVEVMTGLHNPRGITFAPDGALYVAEAGCGGNTANCATPSDPSDPSAPCVRLPGVGVACFGLTGSISRLSNGVQERIATEFRSAATAAAGGVNAVGPTDIAAVETGTVYQLYTTIGLQTDPANRTPTVPTLAEIASLLARLAHIPRSAILPNAQNPATLTVDWRIADIGNYEAQQNPDTGLPDTNPYGLLSEQGAWVVADAGGNSLLRLEGHGQDISTLAVFPSRAQGHRFNGVLIDAVPTSVGPDGAYYVGELTGAPFLDDAANIYRIVPDGAAIENPAVFLSGFKSVIDIAFDARGNLYVLQFATGATGHPVNSGVFKRVELDGCTSAPNECPRTDVVTGLNRPTSFGIGPDGAIYVTNTALRRLMERCFASGSKNDPPLSGSRLRSTIIHGDRRFRCQTGCSQAARSVSLGHSPPVPARSSRQ